MTNRKDYDSSSIQSLGYPESVRLRPGMYIGALGNDGIFTLLREVMDNAVDEALEGYCSELDVFVHPDNKFTVIDNGRGIPKGFTKVTDPSDGSTRKVPTLRAVFGVLHTSGKFNDESYKVSRGAHGIGVKALTALSLFTKVSTFHSDSWNSVEFKEGKVSKDVFEAKAPTHPITGKPLSRGTSVVYMPDPEILGETARLSKVDLFEWARIAAYFTPSITIRLHAKKGEEWTSRELHYPEGPLRYVEDKVQSLLKKSEFGVLDDSTFHSTSAAHDCVLKFTSCDGCELAGFTNGLANVEGGYHVTATVNALRDALLPYTGKKQVFTLTELKDGLVGLVNAKMSGPQFDSQTKEKLVDDRAGEPLRKILTAEFTTFFKKNKKLADAICDRASRLKQLKSKFVASKQMLTELKRIAKKGLPAKAATAPNCKPSDREILFLEGDSASGGVRFARFEEFQEFLPLKGKPPNLLRSKKEEIINEEILNIFAMIGFDPKQEDPVSKLRCGKIILMPDADSDGAHIATLLLAVFYKFLPELFDRGMIFVTRVPEYYALDGNVVYYGDTAAELRTSLEKAKSKAQINHLKGYGECPSDLLRVFACDPKTRLLLKVLPPVDDKFELLMSSDSSSRKILLGI